MTRSYITFPSPLEKNNEMKLKQNFYNAMFNLIILVLVEIDLRNINNIVKVYYALSIDNKMQKSNINRRKQ